MERTLNPKNCFHRVCFIIAQGIFFPMPSSRNAKKQADNTYTHLSVLEFQRHNHNMNSKCTVWVRLITTRQHANNNIRPTVVSFRTEKCFNAKCREQRHAQYINVLPKAAASNWFSPWATSASWPPLKGPA